MLASHLFKTKIFIFVILQLSMAFGGKLALYNYGTNSKNISERINIKVTGKNGTTLLPSTIMQPQQPYNVVFESNDYKSVVVGIEIVSDNNNNATEGREIKLSSPNEMLLVDITANKKLYTHNLPLGNTEEQSNAANYTMNTDSVIKCVFGFHDQTYDLKYIVTPVMILLDNSFNYTHKK